MMSTGAASSDSGPHTCLLGDPKDPRPLPEQYATWLLATKMKINKLYIDPIGALKFSTILLLPAGLAHVPPPIAGPLPEPGGNQAENAFELAAHTSRGKTRWLYDEAIGKGLNLYIELIHSCLYPRITQAIGGEDLFLEAEARDIHAQVDLMCRATVADITRALAGLNAPYVHINLQSYPTHVAKQKAYHVFLAANGAALTEELKLAHSIPNFMTSAHAHVFANTISRFQHDNAIIGAPGRTSDALFQTLTVDVALIDTAPRAYAAKAIPSPSTKSTTGPKPQARKQEWCWSHGKCLHTSLQCTKRAPGHMEAATQSNQMGSTIPLANPKYQS